MERKTPEFNDLVRVAYDAQEEFDNFDPRTPEDQKELRRICADWTYANRDLVKYVLTHGQELLKEMTYDEEGLKCTKFENGTE